MRNGLICLLGAVLMAPAMALPSFKEVKSRWRASDITVLDRRGQPLQQIRVDHQARRLGWTPLEDISPAMRHALIVSEDRRFYQHSGVDWSGVAAAAWGNLWNTRTRGASTLTMQLAGLLDDDLKAGADGRSLWQKMVQGVDAKRLESQWSKAQILEAYLNLVSFRGEQVGLAAMSASLFGKLPAGLDKQESAIAAALIRAPNAGPDRVASRACGVLRDMQGKAADCVRLALLTRSALGQRQKADPLQVNDAPHFARKLLARQRLAAGSRIRSTLDGDLQRFASSSLRRHLQALAQRNVQDGALVVLDNASGDILSWVGSSGRGLSSAANVDAVTALRQAGSTLKPFLFQLAIEGKYLTAASLLEDSPLDLQTAGGLYAPRNYERDYKGLVSVRTALASSLNIPAVRTIEITGPQALRDRLYLLGMHSLEEDGDYYGFSLALGAADIRLIELANAYRTLARQGQYSPLRWTINAAMPASRPLLDAASSFIIADILSDRTARSRTFGLESALSTRYWSAVKTGTSKDMRDNWAVGFSRHYTVAVWVGNASGEPMWDVSGMHGAAPLWLSLMDYLHRHRPSLPPVPPKGVQAQQVRYEGNIEATRQEWFLPGTARGLISARPRDAAVLPPGIVSPLDGSIYAVDPDVPPRSQRLLLRARGVKNAQWWLDGKRIGSGGRLPWFPWPGQHVLVLRDARGQLVEQVRFTVRGAIAKPGSRPPA